MANPEVAAFGAIVQNAAPILVFKGCGNVSIECSANVKLGGSNIDPTDASTQFPAALFDTAGATGFKVVRFDSEAEVYAATMQPTASNAGVKVLRWF